MGLLNAIGAWFEKITDGWVFGTALSKLRFTKNVEIQGTDTMDYTHEFQDKDGIIAHLEDIPVLLDGLITDGLIRAGNITQTGNDISFDDLWLWKINSIDEANNDFAVKSIPPTASGFTRIDIFYGDTLGNITRLAGVEVELPEVAIPPSIPLNTVGLLTVTVIDTGIESVSEFAISSFVRFDINNQNLSTTQQLNARTNIQSVAKNATDIITSPWWRWFDTVKNVQLFSIEQSAQGLERLITLRMRHDTGFITMRMFNGVPQNGLGNEFARFYLRAADSLSSRSLVSWHNFSNSPVFAMTQGGTSRFYTGSPIHPKSSSNDQSVRRDELHTNYIQTITTVDILNNLVIDDGTKLLNLTQATEVTGVVGFEGRLLRIYANGGNRIIRNENLSSLVSNRFSIISDFTITNGTYKEFIYLNGKWRNLNTTLVNSVGAGLSLDVDGKVQLGSPFFGSDRRIELQEWREDGFPYSELQIRGNNGALFALFQIEFNSETPEITDISNISFQNTVDIFSSGIVINSDRNSGSSVSVGKSVSGSVQQITMLPTINGNVMTVRDEINLKGLEEAADYSANKTDFSYVTKKMIQSFNSIAVNYTALGSDRIIAVTTSLVTITLPTSQVSNQGKEYKIDNVSTGNIFIVGQGGELIQGQVSQTVPPDSCINVYANGTGWRIC